MTENIPQKRLQLFWLWSLFFLASVVYNILLPLKKTIIMYIPEAGTESMAYLKPCFITPGAFLLTYCHLKLSQYYHPLTVFRLMITLFFGYFIAYTFFLHPYKEYFALHAIAASLKAILPAQFHAAPPLFAYWMDSLFYTMSELWGPAIVSLLIWGAVNQQFSEQKAQANYAFLTLGVNLSAMVAGSISTQLCHQPLAMTKFYSNELWEQSLCSVMIIVIIATAASAFIYELLSAQGAFSQLEKNALKSKNDKSTYSVVTSMKSLWYDRRLWAIAIIVMVYNVVYTTSDFVFVKQVELFYGPKNKALSNACLAQVSYYTGFVALVLALIIYPLSMKKGGWLATALITPVLFGVTGFLFYSAQILPETFWQHVAWQQTLSWPIFFGLLHICFLRGSRYSLFDATKEIAYIGIPHDEQVQGKAVIDGIASRIGKSAGSMLFFMCYALLGNSIVAAVPLLALLMGLLTAYWIYAVVVLGALKKQPIVDDAFGYDSGEIPISSGSST